MALRHEVETWVQPAAWDDRAKAQRVIDAILASGSEDEAEWVRIAGGDSADIESASERVRDRAEAFLQAEMDAYRRAERQIAEARAALHERIREALAEGFTAYRLAQVTGLSQSMLAKIRRGGQ